MHMEIFRLIRIEFCVFIINFTQTLVLLKQFAKQRLDNAINMQTKRVVYFPLLIFSIEYLTERHL